MKIDNFFHMRFLRVNTYKFMEDFIPEETGYNSAPMFTEPSEAF